jgi:membrane protease YdiL (CAAX protease family)
MIELGTGLHSPAQNVVFTNALILFLVHFVGTLPAGFGEEFGWRGYLLPRLAEKYGPKKGLLVHAFIWWCWHLPVVVGMGWKENLAGTSGLAGALVLIAVSLIPGMLHAVIYAWVWARTGSLIVAVVYHAAFDEVRDVLEKTTGFGQFTELWQMVTIIVVGGLLLARANWQNLLRIKTKGHVTKGKTMFFGQHEPKGIL